MWNSFVVAINVIPALSAFKSKRLDSYFPEVPIMRIASGMRANGENNKVPQPSHRTETRNASPQTPGNQCDCACLDSDKMCWHLFSVLGVPLPYGLKCSLESRRPHWGVTAESQAVGPSSSPAPSLPFQKNKQEAGSLLFFFFMCYAK